MHFLPRLMKRSVVSLVDFRMMTTMNKLPHHQVLPWLDISMLLQVVRSLLRLLQLSRHFWTQLHLDHYQDPVRQSRATWDPLILYQLLLALLVVACRHIWTPFNPVLVHRYPLEVALVHRAILMVLVLPANSRLHLLPLLALLPTKEAFLLPPRLWPLQLLLPPYLYLLKNLHRRTSRRDPHTLRKDPEKVMVTIWHRRLTLRQLLILTPLQRLVRRHLLPRWMMCPLRQQKNAQLS
mmetsp:Transcript_18083/g.36426  ORF Transcript_18083/g.36426 Transcript_18083/m.36426 type:complete len:237 (+) Transcript_18083:853-1563(+)